MEAAAVWHRVALGAVLAAFPVSWLLPLGMLGGGVFLVGAVALAIISWAFAVVAARTGHGELTRVQAVVASSMCGLGTLVGMAFTLNAAPRWIEGMAFGAGLTLVAGSVTVLGIIVARDAI